MNARYVIVVRRVEASLARLDQQELAHFWCSFLISVFAESSGQFFCTETRPQTRAANGHVDVGRNP